MAGLQPAVDEPPDLVVFDLGLPDLDGARAARDAARGVPTSRSSWPPPATTTPSIVKALDAGADDYVIKPFSTDAARRPHPRRAAPRQPTRPAGAAIAVVGDLDDRPARPARRRSTARALELTPQGVRPAAPTSPRGRARSSPSGSCSPRSGSSRTAARTRPSTSTCRGCAASSASRPLHPAYLHTVRGVGVRLAEPADPADREQLMAQPASPPLTATTTLGGRRRRHAECRCASCIAKQYAVDRSAPPRPASSPAPPALRRDARPGQGPRSRVYRRLDLSSRQHSSSIDRALARRPARIGPPDPARADSAAAVERARTTSQARLHTWPRTTGRMPWSRSRSHTARPEVAGLSSVFDVLSCGFTGSVYLAWAIARACWALALLAGSLLMQIASSGWVGAAIVLPHRSSAAGGPSAARPGDSTARVELGWAAGVPRSWATALNALADRIHQLRRPPSASRSPYLVTVRRGYCCGSARRPTSSADTCADSARHVENLAAQYRRRRPRGSSLGRGDELIGTIRGRRRPSYATGRPSGVPLRRGPRPSPRPRRLRRAPPARSPVAELASGRSGRAGRHPARQRLRPHP